MANQFGEKIKQLREAKHLLQRQVTRQMDIDTPMLSKIERGERKAKKEQVLLFAQLYNTEKKELLTLWLADQVYELIKDEEIAPDALRAAESQFNYKTRKKQ